MWSSAIWLSRAAVIVLLIYDFNRRRAEKDRSAVALETGIVNSKRINLHTSVNISLAPPMDCNLAITSLILFGWSALQTEDNIES